MKTKRSIPIAFLSLSITASAALGQVLSYTTPGATLLETFDNPSEDGWVANTNVPWDDGQIVSGWFARYYNSADETYTVPPNFRISSGGSTSPRSLHLFRPDDNPQNGSLGIRPFDGTTGAPNTGSGVFIGAPIQNQTGIDLTSFTLGYTGIQWWIRTGEQNTFVVSWSTDATSLEDGTWTVIPSLQYNSPFFSDTSLQIDGADPDNQITLGPVSVNLNDPLAPGETLWIRWFGENVGGIDQSISFDNVAFTAVPEPTTWALLFGLGTLGMAGWRRFRR